MAVTITIDQVSKQFGSGQEARQVLAGVTLTIAAGEVVALLGASGCGKSTLLRLIAGLERPSSGVVSLDGTAVTGSDPRCSVVFQEPRLFPWKSVVENVAIGARRHAGALSAEQILGRVGLAGHAGDWPHELSGGMAQRAALARALAGAPEVLLLDEPFAALDALNRLRMQDLLSEICAESKPTTVMVTHDVDEAIRLADRIVVLGGTPAAVRDVYRLSDWDEPGAIDALRTTILAGFGIQTDRVHHAEVAHA